MGETEGEGEWEQVVAGESVGLLRALVLLVEVDLVPAHGAHVPLQHPLRQPRLRVVLKSSLLRLPTPVGRVRREKRDPDVCGHAVRADLGKVAAEDAVVEAVEEEEDAEVHPVVGLGAEDEVEAHQRRHDHQVAPDPQHVRHLVQQEEPLVHQPGRRCP